MAKDNPMGSLLLFGGLGVGAYYAWQWWQSQQAAAPSSTSTVAAGSSPSPGAGGSAAGPASGPPSGAGTPSYSGPSLDAMYAMLVPAVIAGYQGGDPAVTCGSGLGIIGGAAPQGVTAVAVSTDPRILRGGHPAGAAGGIAQPAAPASSCGAPMATPDVWNWYLQNRTTAGVSNPPSSAAMGLDENTPISGATYWAAAAPLLQQAIPGLSGYGAFHTTFRRRRGLAGLHRHGGKVGLGFVPCRGFGDAPIDTTSADAAMLAASAAAGGVDTNTGSYTVDPTTGQVTYTTATSTTWFPGISNGAVALGAGVAVLLFGFASMSGGRRR